MRIHEVIRFNDLSDGKKESVRKTLEELVDDSIDGDFDFGECSKEDIKNGKVERAMNRAWCEMEFNI
jgi:hypothetical protein